MPLPGGRGPGQPVEFAVARATDVATLVELQPTEGSVIVAGIVAALTLFLAPAEATLAVAGNAPSITQTIVPSSAAIVVSGNTPAFTFTFAPTEAPVVVAGEIPSVLQALLLAPSEAIVTVDGQIPAFTFEYLPSAAAVVVSGWTPSLEWTIAPSEATVTVDGLTPSVSLIVPDAGTQAPGFDSPFVANLRVRKRLLDERLRKEAEQAVQDAAKAEQALSEAIWQDVDIKPVLDARRIAQEAYLDAYRAEQAVLFEAEEVLRRFHEEVAAYRLEIRRRAALLLLLS